jgi:hypothetical protein
MNVEIIVSSKRHPRSNRGAPVTVLGAIVDLKPVAPIPGVKPARKVKPGRRERRDEQERPPEHDSTDDDGKRIDIYA